MIKLSANQLFFLKCFTGYKSFARKDNFVADQRYLKGQTVDQSYETLEQELLALGLLKADKNGRVSLKLSWDKTRQLMALQNDTIESLSASINEQLAHLAETTSVISRLSPLNPPWPSTDHYSLKDAREQYAYISSILADLYARRKIISGV